MVSHSVCISHAEEMKPSAYNKQTYEFSPDDVHFFMIKTSVGRSRPPTFFFCNSEGRVSKRDWAFADPSGVLSAR